MARKAEIVVRAKHEDALAIDDGLWSLIALKRFEEWVVIEGLRHLDQREDLGLVENIPRIRVFVLVRGQGVNGD